MKILGIDPGKRGGAALMDGDALVWWACWRPRAGGFRVWAPGQTEVVARLADVGARLRLTLPEVVALEGLHVRRGISTVSVLSLAEGAGEMLGGLLSGRSVPVTRPRPDDWARPIGGPGPRQTEAAVAWCRRNGIDLPDFESVGSIESVGAIAEAVLMARTVRV